MPRLSTLSNPTGLVEIDKGRISILLDEQGGRLAFSLARFDVSELNLAPPLDVIVVVRRGNTEERVELGSAWDWDKRFRTLTEIGADGTWVFRVLVVRPGSPRLVAAAENIRPAGQGDSEAFIALEPADLGQRPWEVEVREQEGRAVLRFSKHVYRSTGEAEADRVFTALVLPEAVRRLALWVAENEGALEEDVWSPFKNWLLLHGIDDEPDPYSEEQRATWLTRVVAAFCERFEFVNSLAEARSNGEQE